jgi:predicted RNA binding protein YcfA (HicA-like mRNA interferase family)
MKAVTGKDLCRLVTKKDWQLKKITGSHHIFQKPGVSEILSIPVHGNQTLKIGLKKHL